MQINVFDFLYLHNNYGCNMQFGGDDQWSNMLAGTELIRNKNGDDAYAMTITLLMNSEGKKMGKTANGAVWLDTNKTSPYDFYQYWRNIDDTDVMKCIRMLTFIPVEEIEEMEAWEASRIDEKKEILAYSLTELVHGKEEAEKAKAATYALFAGVGDDSHMPTTEIRASEIPVEGILVADILIRCNLAKSRGEAKRLVDQGGITIDGNKVSDAYAPVSPDDLKKGIKIRKGKKIFHKVISRL